MLKQESSSKPTNSSQELTSVSIDLNAAPESQDVSRSTLHSTEGRGLVLAAVRDESFTFKTTASSGSTRILTQVSNSEGLLLNFRPNCTVNF